MGMKCLRLKSGEMLGCFAVEITKIPEIDDVVEKTNSGSNIDRDLQPFIKEIAQQFKPGKAVFEILWLSEKVQHQQYKAKLRLFLIVRMIDHNQNILIIKKKVVNASLQEHLKAGKYQFHCVDIDELRNSEIFSNNFHYAQGIVKSEHCDYHSQAAFPYYYVAPFDTNNQKDFTLLSQTMSSLPGSIVSFQAIPTSLDAQEQMTIIEMDAMLGRIVSGMPNGMQGSYRDSLAQTAYDSIHHFQTNMNGGIFTYNIIVAGASESCATIAAQISNFLVADSGQNCDSFNLSKLNLNFSKQFLHYPWNVNKKLIYEFRNPVLWQTPIPPQGLFRLPYLLAANELSAFFRLPVQYDGMTGLSSYIPTNEKFEIDSRVTAKNTIEAGTLYDMENIHIGFPPKTLTRHMLVTGKSGYGKTSFFFNLLLQFQKKDIPFLVIEPTKAEYRALIDFVPDIQIFTPGNNTVSPFIINPFIPPKGITVEQYISSLASAFKAAFSMPSPLDSIFQSAIQSAYTQYGWRDYSTVEDTNVTIFGLHEFILVFKRLIEQESYSNEVKGNLRSAGVLRLRNLIEQNPNIYDTIHTVPIESLLSKPTVIELNAIDNEEQKAVLMALILINICVYTKHSPIPAESVPLKNVILIDEAHVLFGAKDKKEEGAASGASTTVKSLENMLVEIRGYGTGIIIADQSPTAVGSNVVKSTEIKTTFRLNGKEDRDIIASTTTMTSSQMDLLPRLEAGEALFDYNFLKQTVLIKTPNIKDNLHIRPSVPDHEVATKALYWKNHKQDLIPFAECSCSSCCTECELRLRSDAAFYAANYLQFYGSKIHDIKTLCGYIHVMDEWLDKQCPVMDDSQRLKLHNCAKIRFIRRIIQQKSIEITPTIYREILQKYLNAARLSDTQ